ncbi:unnamed protein product [Citrullus colocynthis]|uniref:Uncharacterized protein n=1 Tax=Citrullus colocynthis TaxID=252529 RepID=A0ABP0Y0I5_9ROSI
MGQQMERDAKQRTRIWIREDLHTRVEGIKGIVLDLNEVPDELELELEASVFTKMRYLRILEIGEVQLDEDLTYLSKQLRFLNWRSRFVTLKMIDASDSKNLEETPDFSKVPKLEYY